MISAATISRVQSDDDVMPSVSDWVHQAQERYRLARSVQLKSQIDAKAEELAQLVQAMKELQ